MLLNYNIQLEGGNLRLNFDGFVYIPYAAPPSTGTSQRLFTEGG